MRDRRRARHSRRAVSDVVATILLLALTVVLFASIFAFVSSFPAPPAQNSNQFQARLVILANSSGGGGVLTGVSILHLAGPAVPSTAVVYLKSSLHPTWPQFSVPYSLAAGGIPANSVWNLGQTWLLTSFTTGVGCPSPCDSYAPDNVTVYIVSGALLLFSAVIPGTVINLPPTFNTVGTTPATPALGEAFTISAVIAGVVPANTVQVTLSGLPGSFTATPIAMTYSNGVWSYTVAAGLTTASGNYYAFITASNTAGKTATSAVPVSITKYSTLIANAFTVGTVSIGGATCTAAATPQAACQASGDYYATATISLSYVTFGSVLFEVYTTATRIAYTAATHAAFALALTATPTTAVATFVDSLSPFVLQMPTSGFTSFAGAASVTTPLTTLYTISIDLGTTAPGVNTLSFVVLGNGPYSSSTPPVTIP